MFSESIFQNKETRMKILAGYDGSNAARDAVEIAKKHGKGFNGEVIVVRFMRDSHELHLDDMEKADRELEEIKAGFETEDIPCEIRLKKTGLGAGEELVQFAEQKKIDEIVIGVRKRSKVGKLLLGSTAQYVILQAPCPVVTVR
jgi:nucleotide-binding universal stress UspA family protein